VSNCRTFHNGVMTVSATCHWCGTSQKSPLEFSGMIRLTENHIDKEYADKELEYSMFEIAICKKCFRELFDNSYDEMIAILRTKH
jgi:hypothetical protein